MDDKIPVILDTDIGSDIDDTWALAMMLKSPELIDRKRYRDTLGGFGRGYFRSGSIGILTELFSRNCVSEVEILKPGLRREVPKSLFEMESQRQ